MKATTARNTATSDTSSGPTDLTIATRRLTLVAEASVGAPSKIWEPVIAKSAGAPTTDEVLNRPPPPNAIPADLEREIVAVLTRPLRADESLFTGNDNRERELRALFAELPPIQAWQLRRRLDADRNDDPIALAFRRMTGERRQRLRAFLADPRRSLASRK